MAYTYPVYDTGTAQDLMAIVTRAYELHLERTRTVLPSKSPGQRLWLEAPFVLAGLALSRLVELLPADWALSGHEKIFAVLAKPRSYPFDPSSPALGRARDLALAVERDCGRPPALLALISHPPVMGEMAHLNFELVRHAMKALRALRGRPCRPRLVVAVDSFALDTISIAEEGLYAGFMGSYHLGLDRLAKNRNAVSRRLLRRAAWDRMAHRFLALLNAGGEAGMVLAGGVPSTTRTLYAVREWMGRSRAQSPWRRDPAQALRRLRLWPEFAAFENSRPRLGAMSHSAWRLAEAWAMARLAGVSDGGRPDSSAEAGELDPETRRDLQGCLQALGLEPAAAQREISALSEEWARETPYRARFFRILAARVLAKGRPVVILPIAHRVGGRALSIEVKEAWAWTGLSGSRLSARRSAPPRDWEGSAEDFAALFGRENFA